MLTRSGEPIIARLKAACPAAKGNVFSTSDLAGVMEKDQVTPALHVVLFDYQPDDQAFGDVVWDETWLVVAVVKNVARDRIAAQLNDVEPLLTEALAALAGWRPLGMGTAALGVTPGPRPKFSETHAYFPLAFVARPTTGGAECGT